MAATDGTGNGLIEFLEWAGSRGELNPTTAQSYAIASRRLMSIDDELSMAQVSALDLDSIVDRFENLHRTDYTEASMATYQSRFRSAVAMYKAWLDKNPGWKDFGPAKKSARMKDRPETNRPTDERRPTASEKAPEPSPVIADSGVDMVPYELPLRPGLRVRLVLPADLTTADAERLAAFIRSLAFDLGGDTKAITDGRHEGG